MSSLPSNFHRHHGPDERKREEARIARANQARPLAEQDASFGVTTFKPVPLGETDRTCITVQEILGPFKRHLHMHRTGPGPDGNYHRGNNYGGRSNLGHNHGQNNRIPSSSSAASSSAATKSSKSVPPDRPNALPLSNSKSSPHSLKDTTPGKIVSSSVREQQRDPGGGHHNASSGTRVNSAVHKDKTPSPVVAGRSKDIVSSSHYSKDGKSGHQHPYHQNKPRLPNSFPTPLPSTTSSSLSSTSISSSSSRRPHSVSPNPKLSQKSLSSSLSSAHHISSPVSPVHDIKHSSSTHSQASSFSASKPSSNELASSVSNPTSTPTTISSSSLSSSTSKSSTALAHSRSGTPVKTNKRFPNGLSIPYHQQQATSTINKTQVVSGGNTNTSLTTNASMNTTAGGNSSTSATVTYSSSSSKVSSSSSSHASLSTSPKVSSSIMADRFKQLPKLVIPNDKNALSSKSALNNIFKEFVEVEPLHTAIETPQKAGDRFPFGSASSLVSIGLNCVSSQDELDKDSCDEFEGAKAESSSKQQSSDVSKPSKKETTSDSKADKDVWKKLNNSMGSPISSKMEDKKDKEITAMDVEDTSTKRKEVTGISGKKEDNNHDEDPDGEDDSSKVSSTKTSNGQRRVSSSSRSLGKAILESE